LNLKMPSNPELLCEKDHTLHGGILHGLDGKMITIQARAGAVCDDLSWRSSVEILGMARQAVKEAVLRIESAFAKYKIPAPLVQIRINLAPADLPKEGVWLDLPLAVIMLQAAGYLPDFSEKTEQQYVLFGEVGLHGDLRRVPGALSIAMEAKPGQRLIVPAGNERECVAIREHPQYESCRVLAAASLEEVILFFGEKKPFKTHKIDLAEYAQYQTPSCDFERIKGQSTAKDAAVIAAAGGHNLLLVGPPGEGKSLIAAAMTTILPKLSKAEQVELTRIYSAAGELTEDGMVVAHRPMRCVHPSATKVAIVGGGSGVPSPGEITKAHLGILFLDEIAEFASGALDQLRQPLESGVIQISRAVGTFVFPARFTLVAAMNPCPCGWWPSDRCSCAENKRKKYQKTISGPLLDRIDLQVDVERLSSEDRFSDEKPESSSAMRLKVEKVRAIQQERYKGTQIPFNAAMPGGHIRDYCNFEDSAFGTYKAIVDSNTFSTRSMDRLAKVARTIADLADKKQIESNHVEHAASYLTKGILRQN